MRVTMKIVIARRVVAAPARLISIFMCWFGRISQIGLAASVAETVNSKAACLEIASIVNDWRAKTVTVGGFETAIILCEACLIPRIS